jgi:molecular chaperone GrpE
MPNETEGTPEEVGQAEAEPKSVEFQLAEKTAQVEKLEKTLTEEKDRLLRLMAEFENWKKRAKKDVEEAGARGQESLLRELIGVLDNLERALGHAQKDNPLTVGVQMVEKQFLSALEKFGVTRFSAVGKPFDPAQHDAISHIETEDHPAGTVAQEFAKGYQMGARLLRPAMVAVAKALTAKASESANGDGGDAKT